MLIAGAVLEFVVCAGYLVHALTAVATNAGEPPVAVVVLTAVPVAVAALVAASLVPALRPVTTEYLRICSADGGAPHS